LEYWNRVVELVGLADSGAQLELLELAQRADADSAVRRLLREAMSERRTGPLTLTDVDGISKRYAFYFVRVAHDWGPNREYPPNTTNLAKRLDADICTSIWKLDVELRREVEALVAARDAGASGLIDLRRSVESEQGSLAASLDVAATLGPMPSDWQYIATDFSDVCSSLDKLLVYAGSGS
jgi:hypothetical protein